MRTTLTIDDDVAARIDAIRRRQPSWTLKDLVNVALREGLDRLDRPEPGTAFRTEGVAVGACRLPSIDDTGALLDWLDEEERALRDAP